MKKKLACVIILLASVCAIGQVTVVDGLSYTTVKPNLLYRVYYPKGTVATALLPIVVWFHSGGWLVGGRGDAKITPLVCTGDQTIACYLADHGYVVYSFDYTLIDKYAAGSDLTVSAPNTVTATSHTFTQADVGSQLLVMTTGKWSPGGYSVTSVSNGAAVLNASPGPVGVSNAQYNLLLGSALWPAQWQDGNCFLRFLAENAGVTTPGDPQNMVLLGHSSGGQLDSVVGFSGNDAFPSNCDHTSVNYTIKGIVAFSPPSDLVTAYSESTKIKNPVRGLLGCIPNVGNCNPIAYSASPVSFVAENLPPYMSFSGQGDTTVPPQNVQEVQTAFANLSPPVQSQWILLGPAFSHPLDVFYYPNCAYYSEPTPCGSAGTAFQTAFPFIQSVTGRQ